MKNIHIVFFNIYMVIVLSIPAYCQKQTTVELMQEAFHQLDYKTACKIAEQIVEQWQQHSPLELEKAHQVIGVIAYSEGKLSDAQHHFEQAIQLNPHATLDSVYVSPKIIQYFNEIKMSFEPKQHGPAQIRYVLTPDPRPGATVRSMIVPGWGQFHKHEYRKGSVLMAAAGLSVAAWAGSAWKTEQSRDNYLDAKINDDFEAKYQRYNDWYKRQQVCGYVTGAIWTVAIFDALLSKPSLHERPVSLQANLRSEGYEIGLAWRF